MQTDTNLVRRKMRISNIDWQTWQPQEVATLMFIQVRGQVLLIRKKRGLGAGKINAPGGRVEAGETPMHCAIRETEEELCISPTGVKAAGALFFHAEDMPRIHCLVFTATGYCGTPTETDEAIPRWTAVEEIPFDEMWQDDQLWLPQVLSGSYVDGRFSFEAETLLDYEVIFSDMK